MSEESTTDPVVDAEATEEPKMTLQSASAEGGGAQVQAVVDQENAQGFRGVKVDPTPNEHYSFSGQAAGLPTPETDDDHAALAADHARLVSRGEVS